MRPDLGIPAKNLDGIYEILNKVLADGNILYIKIH